jgi:hypothetical protein
MWAKLWNTWRSDNFIAIGAIHIIAVQCVIVIIKRVEVPVDRAGVPVC